MLSSINHNSGGSMEMEVDLRNGITFKNLEDLVKTQMISIDKQGIHCFQV